MPLVLTLLFCVVNGANDGATLIGTGLKVRGWGPLAAIGLLAGGLVIVPAVFGTGVASTLINGIVDFGEEQGATGLSLAVVVTIALVYVLTRLGLPTSLTLALVGSIAGVGVGLGFMVSWGKLGLLALIAAGAPILGGLIAWGLQQVATLLGQLADPPKSLRRAQRVGFTTQAVAYALNDGQKMFAVAAVALGTQAESVPPYFLGLVALCFCAGVVVGLPKVAATVSDEILSVRPLNAVTATYASAAAVLAGSALGAPVSMTQAITGGLVGSGVSESYRRVRWRVAGQLVIAWVLTLPASFAVAIPIALVWKGVA